MIEFAGFATGAGQNSENTVRQTSFLALLQTINNPLNEWPRSARTNAFARTPFALSSSHPPPLILTAPSETESAKRKRNFCTPLCAESDLVRDAFS